MIRRCIRGALFALAVVASPLARAEDGPREEARPLPHATREPRAAPQNTVSTNPVRFAILHFQLEYERIVARRWSAFVAPIFFHHAHWYPFAPSHDITATGGGVDLGVRYTFGEAPAGFYLGPLLSAYRGEVKRAGTTSLEGYVLSAGPQVGYSWLIDWLLLSAGVGASYGIPTARAPDGSAKAAQLPHQGLWVSFRANAGIAF